MFYKKGYGPSLPFHFVVVPPFLVNLYALRYMPPTDCALVLTRFVTARSVALFRHPYVLFARADYLTYVC